MAFVSVIFGSVFGLLSAITGFALFDLHIWQSLLLYTGSGLLITGLCLTLLFFRSSLTTASLTMDKHPTAQA